MARPTYPSDKQDQFMLRLPYGMRDRIRTAADANKRSMNAEIVATLEEKYPAPTPLYSKLPNFDLNIGYFHWLPEANEWIRLSEEVWDTLRLEKKFSLKDGIYHGLEKYFVALVFDDDGELLNIIPHMYKMDSKGRIVGGVTDALTEEENREYSRIYTLPQTTAEEEEFVRRMQDRMSPLLRPSLRARLALRELLRKSTPARTLDRVMEKREWLNDERPEALLDDAEG